MRLPILATLITTLLACGGATDSNLFSDGGGSGNDAGGNSDASSDGSGNGDGSSKDGSTTDAAPDCNALRTQLDALRKKANACSGGTLNACGQSISDFCCPLTVTSPDSADSKAFEAARSNVENLCGSPVCPGTPCLPPSKVCGSNGQCG